MNRFKEKYLKTVVAQMKEKFGYSNSLAVPKVDKIVLNVRISASNSDQKFQELAADTLTRISGQKPIFTKAKKSISSFKIREGQIVGVSVTLRNNRMYDFLDKLVNLSLPNVRDFRGLSQKSIDGQGNLTIGFKEYLAFPEINPDEVENLHGLEVCIHTTAKSKKEGFILLALLGFPFVEKLIDK
ncbi:50S ribosomal protein L5 [Candidatus Kuenenbacteria bacterium CG_4_9_14_3_um_filter_39_14]|uniref:Large ribosomal subunit protein uL5 n=7 Tax=Candidatus Kueneniibacteriota TaxID=1752740 RepID=A0A2M7IMF8_9BACT|nr:50S ribosomal protein L5 [Candidatus Kuenenbacteria bacterium]OIP56774.1 MAG: 50S ribosomal protein L5 [Candidatus Kuenenbacteria bacterium CG2_30_39_24]PIP28945.1 MAG: 50S ribosomal protein L5 [Candidatus Kuenenbacteria bacterium CG23_combo_of_CG06-09_8_20_14_all_39_39]PIP75317.1 MAG: 50S ribosomal protein L5 [Candidatus Kuenenbacteria bacterium CG22_combo_CG10-13_8_21_14_all_39_9]PIR81109.1 MAG: 50S ribosomal protein L5 [Candidatus Kuenenbacteria bacterium CG10_big_fil_rev_8_21_14_0_10_39_